MDGVNGFERQAIENQSQQVAIGSQLYTRIMFEVDQKGVFFTYGPRRHLRDAGNIFVTRGSTFAMGGRLLPAPERVHPKEGPGES